MNKTMQPPVQIAIIGTGLIGPRHASSVHASPSAHLSCLVDPSPASSLVASRFNVPLYRSCAEMLERHRPRPDAAIVCTPNATHVAVSKELLTAGLDVLVEKPIATDVESGRELLECAAKHGRNLLVGHHRRFQPRILAARAAIASGTLGRVLAVNGLWTTYKPMGYFQGAGEWHQSGEAGGVILINMIHEIDLLMFLLGPITHVTAHPTAHHRAYLAPEGAAVLLRFASGTVGTFTICDATPSPYNFEAATGENPLLPYSGQDVYRVFGTEAALSVPDMVRWSYDGCRTKGWEEVLKREVLEVQKEEVVPFDLQVANLVGCVRGLEEAVCGGEEGLRALVVCEGIRRAVEMGGEVDVRVERLGAKL